MRLPKRSRRRSNSSRASAMLLGEALLDLIARAVEVLAPAADRREHQRGQREDEQAAG